VKGYKGNQRKNTKTIAATPVAPRTRGTTMWPAPLFLELLDELVEAEALALTVDPAGADVPAAAACVAALVAAGVAAAAPDDGASEPLISAWTVALKVPVMPVRLFKSLREELESRRGYDIRELGGKCLGIELGLVGIFQTKRHELDKAGKRDWSSFMEK
jgi:hypothetical protein